MNEKDRIIKIINLFNQLDNKGKYKILKIFEKLHEYEKQQKNR